MAMIDFSRIEEYRENNRIEAKRALGGLPESIWETYSAFANTLGGVILLGVEERENKSLHTVDLPDPEWLVEDFWELVNDPKQASVNILSDRHVQIEEVDGARIVAITVPRAQRYERPVYIGGDPMTGSYRRSGEGDYRCTPEEIRGMLRDAAVQTQDMELLEALGPETLDIGSVHSYRGRMAYCRPGHVWEELEDGDFLCRLGALGMSASGALHPTAAGLLMFGRAREILRVFPDYALEYRDGTDADAEERSGPFRAWSENLYDFYFRVSERLTQGVRLSVGESTRDAPVYCALREALANSLMNADYRGRQGLWVEKRPDRITISNPGAFRIEVEAAKSGGVSDPRNAALMKMFYLVNIGNGVGGGLPGIYAAWREQGWEQPTIGESFDPERTTLHLPLGKGSAPRNGERRLTERAGTQKAIILEYLTEQVSAGCADIAGMLGVKDAQAARLLDELEAAELVTAAEEDGGRLYSLKA